MDLQSEPGDLLMLIRTLPAVSFLLLLSPLMARADLLPPKSRGPQYPLKTQRMLLTDAEIALARENVRQYPAAKAIADTIVARADAWMAWSDADLRALAPTADVPRAFNVGTAGCPQCGQAIYEKGGTYPWIIDPKTPYKVTCPVDGSTYPSNDYAAYYASGLNDQTLLTGDYPDDGWGWLGPDGHRYWFVAYANHWVLENHTLPAAQYLSRAYVLTGNAAYAKKAAVLLDRIAEVYPNMDYHVQSRYGQLQQANGARYEGKLVNHIWETGVVAMLAEAYDAIWEAIDDTTVTGKTAEQVRANFEANFLEEGIDGYFSGRVRGNFGMHQKALVYAGLARQYGQQEAWFGGLMDNAGGEDTLTGLNFALYNLVYRDGPPYETSPGYNFSWVANITTVAEALHRAGYDVYAIPKMRRLYDGVLDVINAGKFTPAVGDSNNVYGGLVGQDPVVFQRACRAYEDPRYRAFLQTFGATGDAGITRYESLFEAPVPAESVTAPPVRSRLLDGYGMAILNNPANTISLSLYYGYKGGHGHFDRLNFELFANGQVMMPDTGYPDFMNAYVPGIYTWSKNTVAHNTVVVDAQRQMANRPGRVNLFVDKGFARALDIEAAMTYPQTSTYRRRMIMVDTDDSHAYVVDCFDVTGGIEHDYSLHGPPGTFTSQGGEWSAPAPGTLAGPDVPVGYIYDEPAIAGEGYSGSYAGYSGSGFQHLFHVQRLLGGTAGGEWAHERDEHAKLRLQLVGAPVETFLAEAQVSPVKQKQLLTYFIARNTGTDLSSQFVSVMEPYVNMPAIESLNALPIAEGAGTAVEVALADGARDLVLINTGGGVLRLADVDIHTDAAFAVVRYAGDAVAHRWFAGGTYLSVSGQRDGQAAAVTGTVVKVDPEANQVLVEADTSKLDPGALAGRVLHFENAIRRTAHPVTAVERTAEGFLVTLGDELRVGRIRVASIREDALTTATGLSFAPVYDGTYAADPAFGTFVPLREVKGGEAVFVEPRTEPAPFEVGGDAWIVDVGPGDRVEMVEVTAE